MPITPASSQDLTPSMVTESEAGPFSVAEQPISLDMNIVRPKIIVFFLSVLRRWRRISIFVR